MTERRRGDGSAGYILIAVLAVMALVAGLSAATTMLSRSATGSARVAVNGLVTDALSRAGLELAAYQLLVRRQLPSEVNGQQVRLDDGTVTLFVTVPGGKIDLNRAEPALLAKLYTRAGLKRLDADAFAARVVDWRDANGETEVNGAETDDYATGGLPYGPANGDFRSVDELRWVLGVPAADVKALKPYLTVANPAGSPNIFDISPAMLQFLGVPERQAKRIVTLRRTRDTNTAAELMGLIGEREGEIHADADPPPVVRVRVETTPESGPKRVFEATLARDPTGREPYLVIER